MAPADEWIADDTEGYPTEVLGNDWYCSTGELGLAPEAYEVHLDVGFNRFSDEGEACLSHARPTFWRGRSPLPQRTAGRDCDLIGVGQCIGTD